MQAHKFSCPCSSATQWLGICWAAADWPNAVQGTVGFRPTRGCYNAAGGIVPMTTTRDTAGVMARSVEDIVMFDDIFSDCLPEHRPRTPSMQGLRIGPATPVVDGS